MVHPARAADRNEKARLIAPTGARLWCMVRVMSIHFSEFLLPEPLTRGLDSIGYATPTPVQAQVIPLAMDGADLLVSALTGSGKTAAYLLPIMQRLIAVPKSRGGTRALILVPTRELARQIREHFLKLASYTRLGAGVITGGESKAHQIATLRRNPEILIATPGRLLEFLGSRQAELGELEMLVLDEADRMLDMGFAEDVLAIIERCSARRQSMLFSATLQQRDLRRLTEALLQSPVTLTIDPVRQQHPNIAHQIILSDSPEHKQQQLAWLLANERYEKALIFSNTREGAVALAGFLQGQGQRVAVLHGELEQRERNRVMGLLHSGRVSVLTATDLAARGLDIPGIQLVINAEVPRSGDDYLHRTGRTGRAGENGTAISLVSPPEWNRMESVVRYLELSPETRVIEGLQGLFRGPTKRKGAGKSGKTGRKDAASAGREDKPRQKKRLRDTKNIGKRRKPATATAVEAGHGPLKARPAGPRPSRTPGSEPPDSG
jgi:ATP-dependent RNA helicase SrmB